MTVAKGAVKPLKVRLGVPRELASCHTAQVDGYVIEGHVPAGAIKCLLAEKPQGTGLVVPDMPAGSPAWRSRSWSPNPKTQSCSGLPSEAASRAIAEAR